MLRILCFFQAYDFVQNISNEEICSGEAVIIAIVENWHSFEATYSVVLECDLYYTTESFPFAVLMLVYHMHTICIVPTEIPATFELIHKGLLNINQFERC